MVIRKFNGFLVCNRKSIHQMLFYCLQAYRVIQNSIFNVGIMQLQVAHFLLVASNLVVAICINKRDAIEYIGQINMLATLVILLFVPLIFINKASNEPSMLFNNLYMLGVTIFIINEYKRRMKFAHILPSYKWIPIVNAVCIFTFFVYLII